jgi:hypothetical protein
VQRLTIAFALTLLSIPALAEEKTKRGNPFQYMTRPAPAKKIAPKPAPVVEVQAPVVVEPEVPRRPDPPRFPYRFIGMFGPVDKPIVAFVADDRVVTVQLGAEIDHQFVLRSIGLESVDIGFVNDERTVRVQLGQAQ